MSQHTTHVALGIDLEGLEESLGLWRGESEGVKPQLSCTTGLTTNAIRSVKSTIRKFARNLEQYPRADNAVKRIWPASGEASKRWTMPIVGRKQALNHFAILFEGRMPKLGE